MKYAFLTPLLAIVFSMPLFAGEKVNETRQVKGDIDVEIEHTNGNITIRGWDKQEIKVEGELDDKAEEFIFEERNGRMVIQVKMPKHKGNWNSGGPGDDLEVRVPFKSHVRYSGVNADADIADLQRGLDANTVNGNVEAKAVSGRVGLQSVNGKIEAADISGDINLETVNGRIRDRNSSGKTLKLTSINGNIESSSKIKDVTVETVNGWIELKLGEVDSLEMVTVNGELDVSLSLLERGEIEGSSVSGGITLELQKDVSATFDITGHAGGNIVNRISDDRMQKAKYGPGRWLEFAVKGGKAKVDLSTVSGRIVLDTHNN
ncbi:DUF4097 family beta strand repeat-containing protein [Planctobacterium marinum]|uniref:DUF4097 family beta strand repeat-containing protein n=1 Tax=Planctobacterium marinum TaxID=1631968 RepID=UPI001E5D3E49|nr:DUF4097 family beta strand repeat-containing protein [Planctobacterium marinum]MCC2607908.1 DUF4097 family beta strand repeat-containing protein [Planctobacterium marinum]